MYKTLPFRLLTGLLLIFSGYCANAVPLVLAAYPDVSVDNIVFTHRDAIWVSPVTGGQARIVSDIGSEPRHPKFSPDGQSIAYTATVEGNVDVYVVPVEGGIAKRLTHHPAWDDIVDWYPDGQSILYKSPMQSPRSVYNQLFRIDTEGGLPERLPLPYAETATISQDGSEVLFTYLRDFQEEAWKRYFGGRAPDIWSFDLATRDASRLTDHPAPDSVPMMSGNSLYFLSERGPEMRSNLWRLNRDDGSTRQITDFADDDVRNPSIGDAGIVFEAGGQIYLLDTASGEYAPLRLKLGIARDERVTKRTEVGDLIHSADAGNGSRMAIEARGDVFVYDLENDIARNITQSSASAERYPSLSSDNRRVAYFSDVSGEYQLVIHDLLSGDKTILTEFSSGFRYRPFWSPDGRYLVFMDQQQMLWLVNTRTASVSSIDQGSWRYHWDMPRFRVNWSHDSQWLTYSIGGKNRNQAINVYNVRDGRRHQLTSGFYSDVEPVFDPSGNYLAAIGYRSFVPTSGDIDPTFTYTDSAVVSMIALRDDVILPSAPDWSRPEKRNDVSVDTQDAEARLAILPLPPGRYTDLAFGDGSITVVRRGNDREHVELLRLELGNETPKVLWQGEPERVLDVGADRALLETADGRLIYLADDNGSNPKEIDGKKFVAFVDRGAEFLQMFDESWRFQRDFFYDPGLHGVDWDAIRDHYRPLAAAAHSTHEFTAVIGEMHGELAAGHVFVTTVAPHKRPEATDVGLLGADFSIADGAYVISRILRPGVRRFEHRSPLDEPGLNVSEGDFLLAVNGTLVPVDSDPWRPFAGLAGQHVELTIADSASGRNRRVVRVKTLASERKLRELVWVEQTRRFVEEASGGRIGYIYVPNTVAEGQNELVQMYRAQFHKDALIIDERFNTGGMLGDRFVELLNRPPLMYFRSRNSDDYPLPELAHRGPKALLINSWSYSGGDGFPFLFKEAGVGPLIGTRTWGGLIGPGMRMPLVNGGFVSAPPQRVYDTRGQWAEGNEGVRPNIPLQNNPGLLARGNDQQLEWTIGYLLDEIEKMSPVTVPDFPDKSPEILE